MTSITCLLSLHRISLFLKIFLVSWIISEDKKEQIYKGAIEGYGKEHGHKYVTVVLPFKLNTVFRQ